MSEEDQEHVSIVLVGNKMAPSMGHVLFGVLYYVRMGGEQENEVKI